MSERQRAHDHAAFTVIMPIKPWDGAKSRLHASSDARRALAMAFAQDALAAVRASTEVADVVVVTRSAEVADLARRAGAHVVDEPAHSGPDPLGAAVRQGTEWAAEHRPDSPLAVVPSDLPALSADELGTVLQDAATHELAFVPDANGDGTTILMSRRPDLLRAGYGVGSAERHRSYGAVELQAPAGLRRDVDEFNELLEAQEIGLGPNTAAAFTHLSTRATA